MALAIKVASIWQNSMFRFHYASAKQSMSELLAD
jgi:hypothetical protein